jgi:hypothetical protein
VKLNIEKKGSWGEMHTGELFPGAGDRKCAYESETSHMEMVITAHPPRRNAGGNNRDLPEPDYYEYKMILEKHTGTAITVMLIGMRRAELIVNERKALGRAVLMDKLITTLDFGELANRIFGPGAQLYRETESFPDSVAEAMKKAYGQP